MYLDGKLLENHTSHLLVNCPPVFVSNADLVRTKTTSFNTGRIQGKNERLGLGLELRGIKRKHTSTLFSGKVVNSHCECVAGIGLHGTCKHVGSAFLIIENCVSNGILYISKSSTETLQTFKRPTKLYVGEPVVPEKTISGVNNDDDSRPERFRNRPEFVDEFKMTILNSQLITSWKYSSGSASLKTAILDHEYLAQSFIYY
ncbi:unnamed protein product [Lepeophtheirus salmonis]|uniref:(salmon louse) hypothetical protein n=1 Tax=Lepeophtheirus salmonis TaxID=72036 RepID=A0A7R8CMU7_LEPSM|nr:unnamed protein product [Lepeophtheirus salmonis]CAF2869656.1 unnamed protein product [Lepeophtheirus salmonis]